MILDAEFEQGTEHEGLEQRAAVVSSLTEEAYKILQSRCHEMPCNTTGCLMVFEWFLIVFGHVQGMFSVFLRVTI